MKLGTDIRSITQTLADIKEHKVDLIVPSNQLIATVPYLPNLHPTEIVETHDVHLIAKGNKWSNADVPFGIKDWAHSQISDRLKIDKKYYDRMRNGDKHDNHLLAENINHWLNHDSYAKTNTFLRIVKDDCRAFLSDRYRPLDNYDLLEAILPVLHEKNFTIESANLDEKHMYIKAICHDLSMDIGIPGVKEDIISMGCFVRNSDVGCSSLLISPFIYHQVCKNGMQVNLLESRKRHIGKRMGSNEDGDDDLIVKYLSDETKQAEDKAFWLTVRDTVSACASEAVLEDVGSTLKDAQKVKLVHEDYTQATSTYDTDDLKDCVKLASSRMPAPWSTNESEGILQRLLISNDFTKYGLANAVTNYSQSVESYERATDLEANGWDVVTMNQFGRN